MSRSSPSSASWSRVIREPGRGPMASSVVEYDRMAVPDFQTLMRPLLEEYADGGERPIAEVRAVLGTKFALTPEELAERLPSGLAKTFDNRVGWAATYLYRVGLLARPRRSVYAITDRGRDVLSANPERVDLTVLSQFPEFAEFRRARPRRAKGATTPVAETETATPEERIDAAYQELREALIAEVRDMIARMPPSAFKTSCSTFSMRWITATGPSTPGFAPARAATPGSTASFGKTGSASTSSTCKRSDGERQSAVRSCRGSSELSKVRERRRGSSSPRPRSPPTPRATRPACLPV